MSQRRVTSVKLEHSTRCQADYDESLLKTGSAQTHSQQSLQSRQADRTRAPRPIDRARAAWIANEDSAPSSSREASNSEDVPPQAQLQPARPAQAEEFSDVAVSEHPDSDIEFVKETEQPDAPTIEIGSMHRPNDLAKLVQKLSTFVNKGSEVVWTQKPRNVPRALACKYGHGFKQDKSAGIT